MKKQLFSMAMLMAMSLSASAQQLLPYQNPNLSVEARANDLLSRLTLEEKTKLMMDTSPAIARLGIPQFQWWNEALHGVGRNGFVTVFPITMHMAASWDDTLLYKVFAAVSDEARAKAQEAKKSGNIKRDRKSTRLNSSHVSISYAVFCLKKKKKKNRRDPE